MATWGSFEGQEIARLRRQGHHNLADIKEKKLKQSTKGSKPPPKPKGRQITDSSEICPQAPIQNGSKLAVSSLEYEDSYRTDVSDY